MSKFNSINLSITPGYIRIDDNATGCDSREEVELDCEDISVDEQGSGLTSDEIDIKARALIAEEALIPFDLSKGPLFRTKVQDSYEYIQVASRITPSNPFPVLSVNILPEPASIEYKAIKPGTDKVIQACLFF